MGAPVGNANGAKQRKFYDAMMRAAASDDFARLRQIAEKTLTLAEEGESWAVTIVRDTLDGKPKQQVELSGDADNPLAVALVGADAIKQKLRE